MDIYSGFYPKGPLMLVAFGKLMSTLILISYTSNHIEGWNFGIEIIKYQQFYNIFFFLLNFMKQ